MTADVIAWLTSIDGAHFAALILAVVSAGIYSANQIAKLGRSQAVAPSRPASSNRKSGRVR